MREYKIRQCVLTRLKKDYDKMIYGENERVQKNIMRRTPKPWYCRVCNEEIKPDELVLTNIANHHTIIRHKRCVNWA